MKSYLVSALRGLPGSRLLAGLLFLALPAVSALAQNYTQNFGTAVTPAPTGWTIVGGTWNVSGGTFNHTSNQFREKAIYSTTNWTSNYTYKARVWVTSGTSSGNIAGIIFNYQGPRAYYDVTLNNIGDVILSTINSPSADDVATPIAYGTYSASAGTPVDVEVIRGTGVTTVKVNGVVVINNFAQAALSGGGKIGVFASWATSKYDNIDVAAGAPEIEVQGNSVVIADGDTTPSTADYTDFGSAGVTGATVTKTYIVRNTGTAALTVSTVTAGGDFAVTAQPPASIAAGGSGTFNVRFDPSATGLRTATVSFINGDANENPYNFSVQGSGTSSVASGEIEVRGNADGELSTAIIANGGTPTIVNHTDFGTEDVTSGTTVRTFTIRNLGPGNLTIGSVTVSPSTDFTLLHQPATSIIPMHAPIWSDGRTTFSIQFNPTATGTRTATVSFTNSDGDEGSFSFQIRGTGAAATANPFKTTFPRLAGIFYNKSYSDTAYQQRIAKRDLAVLSFDKGWGGGGSTMLPANSAVNAIKAINPNVILGQYTLLESQYDHGPSTPAIDDIIDKLYAENWWILDGSGNKVTELYYSNMFMTNFTSYTTPDANGDRFPEYLAKRHNTEIVDPVSGLDFWFSDNAFYRPRKDVDWQQNGGADTDSVTMHEYRLAMASYWAKINQLQPGHFVLGNSDGQPSDKLGFLRDPEYQRKLEAAQFETAMGASSSPEGYSGWYNMMTAYRSQLDNTLAPHLVIVGALSTATDGKAGHAGSQGNYAAGAPFAFARYAIASVLMDDGYIEFHDPVGGYGNNPPWFDEFDAAGTTPRGTAWLGTAIDPPQRAPRQNGVFMRRFQYGVAIVNPRTEPVLTNGAIVLRTAQTVDLAAVFGTGVTYKRFQGVQDSVTNNGATITGPFTLQPGDGILLIKQ